MRFTILFLTFTMIISPITQGILFAESVETTHDPIVAEVNGEKIYKSGIDRIITDFSKAGTVIDDTTKKTLIDKLLEQKLVAQFAKKQNYDKRDDVQKQIQVMTEMVLRDSYFVDLIEKNITPKTIKAEFDKRTKNSKPRFDYKASHILVASQKVAEDIKKQLDNKVSFASLAKKYSTDGSGKTGGDLGYFSLDMMVKPFGDAVQKLSLGEISNPVKTDFGWHIIHLTDKRELPKPTLEQLTPYIENDLANKFMRDHTEFLKKKSTIKIY